MNKAAVSLTAVLAAVTLLSGCGPATTGAASDTSNTAAASAASSPSPAETTESTPTTAPAPAATAPKPAAPNVVTGAIIINAAGAVLPNHARTPGATNPAVTQATISRTICVTGWTSTIRPSSSVTTDLKRAQLASGYTYRGDTSTSAYEEDHLISLELGGAPSAEDNLWPEPYNSPEGARVKDAVENKLHALVCGGTLTLVAAQHAIASNWWTAYQTYVGAAPKPAPYKAPAAPAAVQPAPAPVQPAPAPAPVAPGGGATARCNDGTYSFAAHHQGACSRHGGVQVFYK